MEHENNFKIHDTLNLDEIRQLIGDEAGPSAEDAPDILAELAREVPSEAEEAAFVSEAEEETAEAEVEPAEEEEVPEAALPAETPVEEAPEKDKEKEPFLVEVHGMLQDVIYLLAAVTLLFVFVVRLVGVVGDSMLPTLHNSDFLLLESNFLYNSDDFSYGDIVVVNKPYDGGEGPIVKRVIATEGQTVDINFETGLVYVDGVMLQETYVNAPTYNNWTGSHGLEYPAVVPEGCIFVLGDNRNNSMDSRYAQIGMIDERYVLGKVILIALPGETRDAAGNVTDPRDWGRFGTVS